MELSKLNPGSDSTKDAAQGLIAQMLGGELHFPHFVAAKKMASILKKFFDSPKTKEWQLEQARLYGDDERIFHGMKVTIKRAGKGADYSVCNDPVLERLYELKKELSIRIASRKTILGARLASGNELIEFLPYIGQQEHGEVAMIHPPILSGAQTCSFGDYKPPTIKI